MKVTLSILALSLLVLFPTTSNAKTPDGQPPSEESVCDPFSDDGAAWGICNAYCEAMDCDSPFRKASDTACLKKAQRFQELTGEAPPCGAFCPCVSDDLPVFTEFASGERLITACLFEEFPDGSATQIIEASASGAEVLIVMDETENLASCTAIDNTGDPVILEEIFLTPEGAAGCVDILKDTVEVCPCGAILGLPDCVDTSP